MTPPTHLVPHDVGFIGLGVMGAPMARHITAALDTGRILHIHTRSEASGQPFVADGATWHPDAAGVARATSIVVLMVPDLPDVRALLEGPHGLLAGAQEALLIVICSTVSPQGVRDLDAEVSTRTGGLVRVVDAPVSGGEEGAKEGTLSIMLGGPDDDVTLAAEVLAPCGNPVRMGPLGAGQVAKACNQMIVAATVVALSEAAVVAERAGLDVQAMFDLLGGGYAGSRIMEVKKTRFAQHDHSPSGAAKFMVKDLGFATDEAILSGTGTPELDAVRQVFVDLTDAGMGEKDTAGVQAYIERLGRN